MPSKAAPRSQNDMQKLVRPHVRFCFQVSIGCKLLSSESRWKGSLRQKNGEVHTTLERLCSEFNTLDIFWHIHAQKRKAVRTAKSDGPSRTTSVGTLSGYV